MEHFALLTKKTKHLLGLFAFLTKGFSNGTRRGSYRNRTLGVVNPAWSIKKPPNPKKRIEGFGDRYVTIGLFSDTGRQSMCGKLRKRWFTLGLGNLRHRFSRHGMAIPAPGLRQNFRIRLNPNKLEVDRPDIEDLSSFCLIS